MKINYKVNRRIKMVYFLNTRNVNRAFSSIFFFYISCNWLKFIENHLIEPIYYIIIFFSDLNVRFTKIHNYH